MRLREAYDYVKKCRTVIQPNYGFMISLLDLEKELYGDITSYNRDRLVQLVKDTGTYPVLDLSLFEQIKL
jgi:hypothetical protein